MIWFATTTRWNNMKKLMSRSYKDSETKETVVCFSSEFDKMPNAKKLECLCELKEQVDSIVRRMRFIVDRDSASNS